ncbi:hypothetical protein PIB30_079762 [Stylosanthes scabra]|uniref:Retrotransposon gag domain-containing protein n=1 Tax=Stylosanthes scabra TaxID=79078 RepID=A0ABU6WR08_9FABA|nr:hypothetical protein [Stylosanthes scabra]
MEEEIPIVNEGADESSNPQLTPEKEVDQRDQTVRQLEAALRELLERQTREAANASEAVKRAEELARKQQAILDEAERKEKDRQEKLNGRAPTLVDNNSKTAESKDHTWKPFTMVTKILGREKSKHPFSPHILAEELPKNFRYPVEIEPYDGLQTRSITWMPSKIGCCSIESFSDLADSFMKNFTTRRRLPKTCLNLYLVIQKSEETLQSYLDRFNTECTQIEGLQSHVTLMALVKGLREDTPLLKSLTKRPLKTMEEIQEKSHDYLQ